jgi:integrase
VPCLICSAAQVRAVDLRCLSRALQLSDMTLSRHMERRGLEARPHGFRTSLRTWLAEATDAPHEVAEAMIAHKTDGSVVRAYRRTDYLEQRSVLSERWADYVTGGAGQVVKLAGVV